MALPVLRNTTFRFRAEHTAFVLGPMKKLQMATQVTGNKLIEAAKKLYKVLWNGHILTRSKHKIPIAGDSTKLPHAAGLTDLEKELAKAGDQ